MNNYVAQAIVLVVVLAIAGVKSLRLSPDDIAAKLPAQSDKRTAKNLQSILKFQQVLQSNLLILNLLVLVLLCTASYDVFQIVGLAFLWLIAIHIFAGTKAVQQRAKKAALSHVRLLLKIAEGAQPALNLLDSSRLFVNRRLIAFQTKQEVLEAINRSSGVLSKSERRQINAILTGDGLAEEKQSRQADPGVK